jgi:hypothetical protein
MNDEILKSVELTDDLLIDIFVNEYGDDLLIKDGILYYYNGVYWKKDDTEKSSLKLNILISDTFYNKLLKYLLENKCKVYNYEEKHKKVNKLRSSPYIRRIINKLIRSGHLTREIIFDDNKNLLSFENVVYDMEKGIIRSGLRGDNISFSVGYNWIEPKETYNIMVKSLFERLFEREEDRIEICETLLEGILMKGNYDYVLIKEKGIENKLEVLNMIMSKVLGDYYKKMNLRLYNSINNKESGVRIKIYSGLNKKNILNDKLLKKMEDLLEYKKYHCLHIVLCKDKINKEYNKNIEIRLKEVSINRDLNEEDINKYEIIELYNLDNKMIDEYRSAILKYLLGYNKN